VTRAASLKGVLFDYGHTLIDYDRPEKELLNAYHRINERLAAELEREVPQAADLFHNVSVRVDEIIGASYQEGSEQEVDIAALYSDALHAIGLEPMPETLDWVIYEEQRAWIPGLIASPHAAPVLEGLKTRGLRLAIVSNAAYPPESMREQLRHFGLFEYFDATVYSSEIGIRKPNAAIYAAALTQMDVPAGNAIFVGDRLREDIRGPRSVGIDSILTHEFRQEEPEQDLVVDVIKNLEELIPLLKIS
jgi:putative hydrolase of the HAD superfamily